MIDSVAVISKNGQLLLVRQFTHVKHSQIEGHLAAFPQLVESSGHNYIDTETVRLVYQEVNDLYIVIAVSKDENVIEALDTVSLFVEVTRNICGELSEEKIISCAIDLLFAYDECVFDGYARNITSSDVLKFLKMQSVDEENFLREREEKAQRQRELLAQREKQAKSGDFSSASSSAAYGRQSFQPSESGQTFSIADETKPTSTPSYKPQPKVSGMVIGKANKTARSRIKAVMAEEGLSARDTYEEEVKKPVETSGIQITLAEKFKARLSREGNVEEIACEGRVMCVTGKKTAVELHVNTSGDRLLLRPFLQPNKQRFKDEKVLVYDTNSSSMAPGSEVCVLGWKKEKATENDLPFSMTNWITPTGNTSTFSCDVQLKLDKFSFNDIIIQIPIENPRNVNVSSIDGEYECFTDREHGESYLKWTIAKLDKENSSAELEFSVDAVEEDAFYPIAIAFNTPSNICGIDIDAVTPVDGDEDVKYTINRSCVTSDFRIE